jgi:hypothetical protein
MFDLANFTLRDMTELGGRLRRLGDGAATMEEVARRVVRTLHDELIDGETGARACVLVRFFKTHPYAELEDGLRAFARHMLDDPRQTAPGMRCLTLLATAGERPEWNRREASAGHKAIPLASADMVSQAPMISRLLSQLGVRVEALLGGTPELLMEPEPSSFNVFYVGDAKGSDCIPAQDDFVKPCGIESVLGFGGMLPAGDIFVVILFSNIPITRETAALFRTLALNVKIAALDFDGAVFSRQQEGTCPTTIATAPSS